MNPYKWYDFFLICRSWKSHLQCLILLQKKKNTNNLEANSEDFSVANL